MSQKPIHKRNALETRDAIWAVLRQLRSATIGDIHAATRASRDTVREYLSCLSAAGYVTKVVVPGRGCARTHHYNLINDPGIDAPRVRRDGTPCTLGAGHQNMWRVMKVLGEFSAAELALHASTDIHEVRATTARDYCYHLCLAGYLVKQAGGERYRLLTSKWSGPRPPQVQRINQIYDPNLQQVVWIGGANDQQ